MERCLIVNADDFGLHPDIDHGVRRAVGGGIVTSLSCVANGPCFDDSASILRGLHGVSVGIHLNLTDGRPLTSASSLGSLTTPEGRFLRKHHRVVLSLLRDRRLLRAVEAEFEAQVLRLSGQGFRITHLDSHGHVHLVPALFPVVCRLAQRHGIPFVRVPMERPLALLARWPMVPVRILAHLARRVLRRTSLRSADHYGGMGCAGRMGKAELLLLFKALRPGTTELCVHPASDDRALAGEFDWGYSWSRNMEALMAPEVRVALRENGIRLVGFPGPDLI